MAYVSARYIKIADLQMIETTDRFVAAIDDEGTVWHLDAQDCGAGAWLQYLANGGTIEPYVETQPA